MGLLQSPPNMLGFLVCATTALMALIAMALSAATCDVGSWCALIKPTQPAAAAGLGVASGVLGVLVGALALAWYVVTQLWDVGVLRFVLVGGWVVVSLLAFVAGIIYAVALDLPNGTHTFAYYSPIGVAACVWQWLLFVLAALSAFFCWKAGGGGTAAVSAVGA